MNDGIKRTTLGELRQELTQLLTLSDDTDITFGNGNITIQVPFKNDQYRADNQTPQCVNIRFDQCYTVTFE